MGAEESLIQRLVRDLGAAKLYASLRAEEREALPYQWAAWARPSQMAPPGAWTTWLQLKGRGSGKTRSAAEWIRDQVEQADAPMRIALVAPTPRAARKVMIEGESGLLNVFPPWRRPKYEPSKLEIYLPGKQVGHGQYIWHTGFIYSAFEAEHLRGPEHHIFWAEEVAAWKQRARAAWSNLMLGLRLGDHPRGVATTTPKPLKILREILADKGTVVSRGSTYDNFANLPQLFIDTVVRQYEGTRLGRQELHGEILDDMPGALWTRALLEASRLAADGPLELERIVVGVDPMAQAVDTDEEEAFEAEDNAEGLSMTGISVCGRFRDQHDRSHLAVLDDLSVRGPPEEWSETVAAAFSQYSADRIVAEANNGGDMVRAVLQSRPSTRHLPVKLVHASRGKRTRAEPISMLWEQKRAHVVGHLAALEDILCTWVPGMKSPDRMDAMVWAGTDLMLGKQAVLT